MASIQMREIIMDQIILVVDDDVTSLKLATGILDKEYRVAAATSGPMTFKYLEKNRPNLILLDINMPDMNGFEVMDKLQENPDYAKIPVIFLTASQGPQIEAECLQAGGVDFVSKPYVPMVLKSRVQRILELYEYRDQLESINEEETRKSLEKSMRISGIQDAVIIGMANLIEERDNNTGYHVKNTQVYVKMICEALHDRGLYTDLLTPRFQDMLIKSAPLHDVGKIKITDLILQKPGKLSTEEYKIIQNHTRYGADIIDNILGGVEDPDYLEVARDVALYHHERWDGNGYPEGLRGEEIPLGARIMALADVFDALYADRVYRAGIRPLEKVLSIMEDSAGTQFDPILMEVFLSLKDQLQSYVEKEDAYE